MKEILSIMLSMNTILYISQRIARKECATRQLEPNEEIRMDEGSVKKEIASIVQSQRLAVMSTERGGQPYSSLMAYACSEDLAYMVVATGKATRKNINLQGESRVSLLIDNRNNTETDFHEAAAVTVVGEAHEVSAEEREEYEKLYLAIHPYLGQFIHSPTTVMYRIKVLHYIMVTRFQHVMELHMTDEQNVFS